MHSDTLTTPLIVLLTAVATTGWGWGALAMDQASASTGAEACLLKRDSGVPCADGSSPSARKFYFDSPRGVCQPFSYSGCGGNDNRFVSAEECRKRCSTKASQSQWVHAEKCNGTYLVPDGKYSECKGDGSGESCPKLHQCHDGVCCPSKEHVCSLRDDSGTFAEGVADKPRFAWSDDIKSCWRFSYYGAHGNYNNFPSYQACVAFCGSNGDDEKKRV